MGKGSSVLKERDDIIGVFYMQNRLPLIISGRAMCISVSLQFFAQCIVKWKWDSWRRKQNGYAARSFDQILKFLLCNQSKRPAEQGRM